MTIDAASLYEPSSWANNQAIHDLFTRMRNEDPVHFCESKTHPNLWHVTKQADIFDIERRTAEFLCEPRSNIYTREQETRIRAQTGGTLNRIRSLVTYDAPDHMKLRLLTQAWFMPKNLEKLQDQINASVKKGMVAISNSNGQCDFARDVALEFPLRVIMGVLGIPESDYSTMLRLTQELFSPEDPDAKRDMDEGVDQDEALQQTVTEFFNYFNALTEEKIKNPKDDIASIIANAEIDGEPLDMMGKLGYYIIVATAGHDTTSYSLTEAVHHMSKNQELLQRLKQDPDGVAPMITEEAIRFASSVRHFVRTATQDLELGGQSIKKGDSLVQWFVSGSRDEDVFDDPHTFNIDRPKAKLHAAFGHGPHVCLGQHLARQEITAFLKTMAQTVDGIEPASEPKYAQANFVGGIKSLPVQLKLQ